MITVHFLYAHNALLCVCVCVHISIYSDEGQFSFNHHHWYNEDILTGPHKLYGYGKTFSWDG